MKKQLFFSSLFVAVFCFATLLANAQSITVSGSIGKGTVSLSGTTRAVVVMNVPAGLHVNTSRPGSEYAIPTSVRITCTGCKAGQVSYPRGRSRKFAFSEDSINVYEGRVSFTFPITVAASVRGGVIRVRAVVRYQACTNEVCYPPTSKTVIMSARIL